MYLFTRFQSMAGILRPGVLFVLGFFSISVYAAPSVVVTIPPVHSLLSTVMKGVAEPTLLIPGGQSPHTNTLKPSAIREVVNADLLVWVSPDFEIGLQNIVKQQTGLRVLTLVDVPDMRVLPVRTSSWHTEHATHDHTSHSESQPRSEVPPDMHLWLSTENAVEIVRSAEQVLREMDPLNALIYKKNAGQAVDNIYEAAREITQSLQPVKSVPYLVFHDAYQYFEAEFDLSPVGAVTLSPERKPGIRSLLGIKQNIQRSRAKCIFHEPQFQPRLVTRIAEETGIRTGELDPIGAVLQPGSGLWFELMYSLRDSILRCTSH